MHVLERVVAIPYSFENEVLRIAVADPANLHGIDELRLATRYPIELGVGSRDEILIEIQQARPRGRGRAHHRPGRHR